MLDFYRCYVCAIEFLRNILIAIGDIINLLILYKKHKQIPTFRWTTTNTILKTLKTFNNSRNN